MISRAKDEPIFFLLRLKKKKKLKNNGKEAMAWKRPKILEKEEVPT